MLMYGEMAVDVVQVDDILVVVKSVSVPASCVGMVVGTRRYMTVLLLNVVAHIQVSEDVHVCLACVERDKRTNSTQRALVCEQRRRYW